MNDPVFIISIMESKATGMTEAFILNTIEDVNLKLEEITYGHTDYSSIEIHSGIIIPCEHIPASFNGTVPYILIQNPDRIFDDSLESEAYFFKSSSDPKVVAEKIEYLMEIEDLFWYSSDSSLLVNIEDVQLFFGYTMVPILQVVENDIDEEVMERLEKIKQDAMDLKNKTGRPEWEN